MNKCDWALYVCLDFSLNPCMYRFGAIQVPLLYFQFIKKTSNSLVFNIYSKMKSALFSFHSGDYIFYDLSVDRVIF
jgi:hypothetical protein